MKKKFNILKFLETRPLSWSAISSFEYNPDQWYRRYVLAEKDEPTPEMLFGKHVGERLAAEPDFLPQVPRYKEFEYELRETVNKIPMLGFIDSYSPHRFGKPALYEYKTGRKPWDQERADQHGQITMYLLMLHRMHKLRPEDVVCHILWLPTQLEEEEVSFIDEKDVRTFETKRTMRDLLDFGIRVQKIIKEMEAYANSRL